MRLAQILVAAVLLAGCRPPDPTTTAEPSGTSAPTPAASTESGGLVGKKAPALQVTAWANTSGQGMDLDGLLGKVVVLDFWAFW